MDEHTPSSRLPDRWLNCPKIGSLLADIFVPFKTPLDDRYRKDIAKTELYWEPSHVIGICEARNINLGLIVDLTFAKRYYKPEAFIRNGIVHKKIACRGHNETPDATAKQEFIAVCLGYLQNHRCKKIGVHCTHGYNRTGFLICAYLVEELHWSISAAVREFQKAREPGIYKPEYISALIVMYGDEEDTLEAAPWPTWEDPATQSDDIEREKRSKEFMSGIPGVSFVGDRHETEEIQRKAAEMCGFRRQGFPGMQPVSMDCDNLLNLKEEHHVVSWKADGTRYMMLIAGKNRVYFLDRDNAVFKVDGLSFPWKKDPKQHLQCTLLDGEMVIDNNNGTPTPRFLIYDIAFCEKFPIRNQPFSTRVECIKDVIIGARSAAAEKGIINMDSQPFRVRLKEFYDVSMTEKLLGEKFQSQLAHEIDGLIFQPSAKPYKADRCDYILKWKPPELNTIDFRLKIETTKLSEGDPRKLEGFLFVGGLNKHFAKLGKVAKQDRALDGKIVECCFQQFDRNGQTQLGWVMLRERTDKSFPNGYKTALGVMKSIQKPITKDNLIKFINKEAVKEPGWPRSPGQPGPPVAFQKRPNSDFLVPQVPPQRAKMLKDDD
ncbi:mRNA-capping enzyme-like [Varroa jacobsoni]|uniref:mRNA-capping enzyme n=1 Tax=Varroa destructor TaxID=109461 RepID=A0A7M7K8F5_VARDE|nr:mRNA-capping enzyme-like [Varroa destructor]XP_022661968.1 mRNA-capping enzyme-like [Varroa destructor]XP_022661970.1 mRNA-capping enzyme-like [Varroa destructor]XP_022661971.1 mRNA-capping enzyme-like [Varroa destructor]XP_022690943.1 mRNA-capping enzyme-like [Varroa jacobsoni]